MRACTQYILTRFPSPQGEYELDDMPTDVETDYCTESEAGCSSTPGPTPPRPRHPRPSPAGSAASPRRGPRDPRRLRGMAQRRAERLRGSAGGTGPQPPGTLPAQAGTPAPNSIEVDIEDGSLLEDEVDGDFRGDTDNEAEGEESPLPVRHVCRCGADPRGAYQRMVVTAILEKPHRAPPGGVPSSRGIGVPPEDPRASESGESDTEIRTRYIEKLRKHYYALAQTASSDIESEGEACPITKPPIISVTYVDEPPAYDCMDYKVPRAGSAETVPPDSSGYQSPCDVTGYQAPGVPQEMKGYQVPGVNGYQSSPLTRDLTGYQAPPVPTYCDVDVHGTPQPPDVKEKSRMFVALPEPEKKPPPEGASVVFVELPPKGAAPASPLPPVAPPTNSSFSIGVQGHTTMNLSNETAPCNAQSGLSSVHQSGARMRLCGGSESFPSCPVPTLAIIPPTPLSDAPRPGDAELFSYIDEEEESDPRDASASSGLSFRDSTSGF